MAVVSLLRQVRSCPDCKSSGVVEEGCLEARCPRCAGQGHVTVKHFWRVEMPLPPWEALPSKRWWQKLRKGVAAADHLVTDPDAMFEVVSMAARGRGVRESDGGPYLS